jgi:hypothetical protein
MQNNNSRESEFEVDLLELLNDIDENNANTTIMLVCKYLEEN